MESEETRQLGQALERAYRRGWDDAIGPDGDVLTTEQRRALTDSSKTLEYVIERLTPEPEELHSELGRLWQQLASVSDEIRRILDGEIQ